MALLGKKVFFIRRRIKKFADNITLLTFSDLKDFLIFQVVKKCNRLHYLDFVNVYGDKNHIISNNQMYIILFIINLI